MTHIPENVLLARKRIANQYLFGKGIEIGALDAPLPIPESVEVRYVDRMKNAELLVHYPELANSYLVDVDIVDDGERLSTFHNNTLDFLIASHMLEHCENPLGTIRNHLRAVKHGGIIFYIVPDKRCCFDECRPLTEWSHILKDEQIGPDTSRWEHYLEWARYVDKIEEENLIRSSAQANMNRSYSIHFHVWDCITFMNFLVNAQTYLGGFEVRHFEFNEVESIAILRKS